MSKAVEDALRARLAAKKPPEPAKPKRTRKPAVVEAPDNVFGDTDRYYAPPEVDDVEPAG